MTLPNKIKQFVSLHGSVSGNLSGHGDEARAMNQIVRMLHTSDVHIGHVRGSADAHGETCQCPAHGLADAVIQNRADILMIAGDLFDHARLPESAVRSPVALERESSSALTPCWKHSRDAGGGSSRYYICHSKTNFKVSKNIKKVLSREN